MAFEPNLNLFRQTTIHPTQFWVGSSTTYNDPTQLVCKTYDSNQGFIPVNQSVQLSVRIESNSEHVH